ncbi:MAG: PKD domain-containing protein, partial [Actinomycetota bacterium]
MRLGAVAAVLALLGPGCVGLGSDDEPVDPQTFADEVVPAVTVDPPQGPVTTTFTFDASATDVPGTDDASFDWDFGDGGRANGKTVQHVFAYDNNAYRVVLTISAGAASAEHAVIVPVGSGVNTKPT